MNESPRQSFGGQALTLGFVQVVIKLRLLIVLPVLSRLLTKSDFGVYSILTAFVAMIQIVCLLGVNSSLRVFIPAEHSPSAKSREFWSLAAILCLQTLVVVAFLAAFRAPVMQLYGVGDIRPLHYAFALAMMPLQTLNALFLSQALNNWQAQIYARINTIASAMELVLMIAAAMKFGLPGVLAVLVLKQAFMLVFMSRAVLKATPFERLSVTSLPQLKKYYSYGFIMFLTGLMAMSVEHSDKFFLGKIRGLDSLGVYSVSYGVCVFLADLAMPIFYILLPVVASHVAEGQHEQARHYLERSFRALMLIYTPAVIFFSMEARDMLGVFTVREYFDGAVIFPWVAVGIAVFQINGIHTYALHAHRKGAQELASLSLAAVVNIGLNFWLIPQHGIVGAAWATFIAYLLHFVIMRHCANRCIRVRYGAGFLAKLAFCGAGTGGVIYLVQQIPAGYTVRLLAALVLGGAAYVVLLAATNCVSADERRQLVQLVRNSLSPDRGRT